MRSMAEKFEEAAEKSEKGLEYKTGEVAGPGTLSCKECGAEMKLTTSVRIPPCPKCHKTVFRITF
jgi:Zn finger protein HypA/HybF involved in hydrogenase expression